jgi:drug/metabolite transporter (DMT)-like permease
VRRSDDLTGIVLMTAAMAGFAVSDAAIASAADRLPAGQVTLAYGAGGALVLMLIARARRQAILTRDLLIAPVVVRNLCEAAGTLGIVMALATLPFVTVSALMQAMPVVYTAAAAIWLGARITGVQWAAVLAGFAGVLLILRPGTSFDVNLLWLVLAIVALTWRDIVTRRVPPEVDSLRLAIWAFLAILPLGAAMTAWQGTVTAGPKELALLGVSVLTGVAGYWAITAALRVGAPGAVTPFRYARLLFGLMIGILLFGETPDGMTLTGAAIIVAAGLVALGRAR